jgi:hypothetical protein
MSERRLLEEDGGDTLTRELLRAGVDERPSEEARRRALSALGLPAGAAGAGSATVASASAGHLALGPGRVTVVPPAAPSVALHPAPAPTETAASPLPAVSPPSSSAPVVVAPLAASVTPHRVAPRAAASADDDGLGAEVAVLDGARQALAAGETTKALATLDSYERTFPRGVLGQEAVVLRIEVLVAAGKVDGARAVADRFLAAHPSSPHATRIRHLLGEPVAPP